MCLCYGNNNALNPTAHFFQERAQAIEESIYLPAVHIIVMLLFNDYEMLFVYEKEYCDKYSINEMLLSLNIKQF